MLRMNGDEELPGTVDGSEIGTTLMGLCVVEMIYDFSLPIMYLSMLLLNYFKRRTRISSILGCVMINPTYVNVVDVVDVIKPSTR
jgi:hypothetical protein